MKKILTTIIVILILCVGAVMGLYYYGKLTGTENIATNIVNKFIGYKISKEIEKDAEKIKDGQSQNSKYNSVDLSEEDIINIMHQMANTKVIADEKWGEIEITPERVKNLKTIVEGSDFESKDKLLEILERWEKGDFSVADKDHNYLWEKLGGTIGRATGVLE